MSIEEVNDRNSDIEQVKRDIARTLERIQETARAIQALAEENEALRTEIADRRRRLSQIPRPNRSA